MAVEFPNSVSFFFGNTEKIFKEYVRGVCSERGYSNNEPWTVATAYGFGNNSMSGGLDTHVRQIYEKMKDNLTGYGSTKRWANRAADAICPPRSGGGGSLPRGSGEMRHPFSMMTMITGIERFFVHITAFEDSGEQRSNLPPATQQLPASALFTYQMLPYRNQSCLMFPFPAWQIYAPPMSMMVR